MAKTVALPTKGLKSIHSKGVKLTGWVVFVLATVDGWLLARTFLADWWRQAINLLPTGWSIGICLILGVVGIIIWIVDPLNDLNPNGGAVTSALATPTIVSAISGGFASWISALGGWAFRAVDQWLAEAVPNGLGIGNDLWAIALTVGVVMLAQRFNKKG